jgi:hypothetical protein
MEYYSFAAQCKLLGFSISIVSLQKIEIFFKSNHHHNRTHPLRIPEGFFSLRHLQRFLDSLAKTYEAGKLCYQYQNTCHGVAEKKTCISFVFESSCLWSFVPDRMCVCPLCGICSYSVQFCTLSHI